MSAKYLRVVVKKNGKETVNLTMPIYSLKIIDTLMPETVISKLKLRNIDLKELVKKVVDSEYKPQDIFSEEFTEGELIKKYRVWVE
jgi:hypothetical protein